MLIRIKIYVGVLIFGMGVLTTFSLSILNAISQNLSLTSVDVALFVSKPYIESIVSSFHHFAKRD